MEEIMNNETIENVEEETALTVPETEEEAILDRNEGSGVGTLAIGAGICGLAVIGAVTVGKVTWKHVLKPIGKKIKGAFTKEKEPETVAKPIVVTECCDEDDADETEE